MLIRFDNNLNISLSTDSLHTHFTGILTLPDLYVVDIVRIIDWVATKEVYVRVGLEYRSGGYIPPSGVIKLSTLSNGSPEDNIYNNPQWTYSSVVNAVSALFINAAATGTCIGITSV